MSERDGKRCSVVEVDGESVRVMGGADDWTNQDFEAFAEVVRAAKRKFQAEDTPPAEAPTPGGDA